MNKNLNLFNNRYIINAKEDLNMTRNYSDRGASEQYRKIFGERLSYYIAQSNKTQAQVAKELGFNASTLNMWCKGNSMPTAGKIQKIADYFHIRKSDLIEYPEVPEYVPGTVEIIDLYSRVSPEQREAVLNLLRSFIKN